MVRLFCPHLTPLAEACSWCSGCRDLLREKKVGPGARWSKLKEQLAGDARYKALPRESREHLFRAFVAEAEVRSACLGMRFSGHAGYQLT